MSKVSVNVFSVIEAKSDAEYIIRIQRANVVVIEPFGDVKMHFTKELNMNVLDVFVDQEIDAPFIRLIDPPLGYPGYNDTDNRLWRVTKREELPWIKYNKPIRCPVYCMVKE